MIQLNRRTVAAALAAFLVLAVIATTSLVVALAGRADASHRFNDIADGTFYHDSTAWLADNGIANGFPDGSFGTGQNITRGQASFWFNNYNDNVVTPHVDATTDVHGIADTSALATDSGVAAAVTAYNDSIEVVTFPLGAGSSPNGTVSSPLPCPSGKRAISGGIQYANDFQNTFDFNGYPYPGGWRVIEFVRDGTLQNPIARTLYAVCIPTESG